jgi:DnaJ-class molecular chaperone
VRRVGNEVKIKVLCPRCEGTREVIMKRYPQSLGAAKVRCPECKGSGWIEAVFIADTGGRVDFSS